MQRITQYDGLYGEASGRTNAEYIFSELLETRSRSFDWVIKPHIHARLFQVFFVQTGQLTFRDASGERNLMAPVILLIPPAALHGLTYTSDSTGHILTLSDALVESLFPDTLSLNPMLGAVQSLNTFEEPYQADEVHALIKNIDQELFGNQAEKRTMLKICLQRFFLVLFRLWEKNNETGTVQNTQSLKYFQKFQQRVRQVGTTHSVAQIADDLAITPVHMNRICRQVAGKSASQMVQEYILDEARKYLTYTSYSVSEIAYLLKFEYPNYFARFFRKHTGLSPTEFREKQEPH